MLGTIHYIPVNFRMECFLDLRGRAGKFNRRKTFADSRDLHPVRLQPGFDRLNILRGRTKLLANLIGSEPFVIAGR